jgi:hypothetical protein
MLVLSILLYLIGGALVVTAVMAIVVLPVLAFSSTDPWFCNKLGWHRTKDIAVHEPPTQDGRPGIGVCVRCGKKVTTDYFGNWG